MLPPPGYGHECFNDGDVAGPFEPRELKGRLLLALAVGGTLPDHGTPNIERARLTDCGLPPGYLERAYGAHPAGLRAWRALGYLGARGMTRRGASPRRDSAGRVTAAPSA